MSNRRLPLFLAVLVAVVGVGIRASGIAGRPLGQDEAESAIYALQILAVGYPQDEFLGERLYENRSFIPDNHPKYEFQSTNFVGSRFEKNKGWLPHYFIAAAFKLFGVGAWQARLPSVVVSAFTVIAVYALSRLALSPPSSLLAATFYAVNPLAIAFDRQARYYALLMLLSTLALVSFGWLRQTGRTRWLSAAVGCLVLLFHTHALAAIFFGGAGAFAWVREQGWGKLARQGRLWAALGVLTLATVPWAIIVNLPAAWQYASSDPMQFRPLWLVMVAVAVLAVAGLTLVVAWLKLSSKPVSALVSGWVRFSLAYAALLPLVTPAESVAERLFLPLLPLLTVVGATLGNRLVRFGGWTVTHGATFAIFLLVVAGGFTLLAANSRRREAPYRVDWVVPLVNRLKADGRLAGRLLLTDYNQFPMTVESGLPFQLLSVLRCSYLQAYPGPILYVSRQIATAAGTVLALPFCNPQESDCIQRTLDRQMCLQAGRDCIWSEIAGTTVTDCTASRTL